MPTTVVASSAGWQRPVVGTHSSSTPQRTPTHADASKRVTNTLDSGTKRTTARCTTTASSALHPFGLAHPRASSDNGVSRSSLVSSTPTCIGSALRPALRPSAVVRSLRIGPVAPPRRRSDTTDCNDAPSPRELRLDAHRHHLRARDLTPRAPPRDEQRKPLNLKPRVPPSGWSRH